MPKNADFFCEKCCFRTHKKSNFEFHLSTLKHKKDINISKMPKEEFVCESCNKLYNYYSGLWRHKKTCIGNHNNSNMIDTNNNIVSTIPEKEIIDKLLESNENKNEIIISLQQQLIDALTKNANTIINNNDNSTTTTNNNNNSFNIQIYLNEKCSNAMNIDTFLKSISVSSNNVLDIGYIGYHKEMGNLFLKHIRMLDQLERPIQTTDMKRKLSWIKNENDEWIKDEDLKLVNNFILLLADKYFKEYMNSSKIIKEWNDTQSKEHDKTIKSVSEIMTVLTSDDKNGDYAKIQKIISENTLVRK